ncbi:hypothetical protein SDRG_05322 [Saprolegnia diclina VS20]|uniref:TRP C-terminal domain-containing protein n=1 Tax=Saprolegnia diclina (strain VS20) TaxID=1156394 RepID=T0QSV7_SAPDV|nr:hypothetical protein SDRG_05322 [Saprolegnia diclina VS20]EQC37095.1 hypothetical protein SDRG_05322 [Saprolegnia diclina VS20]|eukprot:XP_008609257.1 hypothetical protein SDRG_05322 [Saprolegnia diclina VS20]
MQRTLVGAALLLATLATPLQVTPNVTSSSPNTTIPAQPTTPTITLPSPTPSMTSPIPTTPNVTTTEPTTPEPTTPEPTTPEPTTPVPTTPVPTTPEPTTPVPTTPEPTTPEPTTPKPTTPEPTTPEPTTPEPTTPKPTTPEPTTPVPTTPEPTTSNVTTPEPTTSNVTTPEPTTPVPTTPVPTTPEPTTPVPTTPEPTTPEPTTPVPTTPKPTTPELPTPGPTTQIPATPEPLHTIESTAPAPPSDAPSQAPSSTPSPVTPSLQEDLGDQPTALPARRPSNRSNWPSQKLAASSSSTNIFRVVANALAIPGLIALGAFHFGWWTLPAAPVIMPMALAFLQQIATCSLLNLGTSSVPSSLLGFTDGLTWVLFQLPHASAPTTTTRRLDESLTGSGPEFFAYRANLNERHLFYNTWLATVVVTSVCASLGLLCLGCARFFSPPRSVGDMKTMASRCFALGFFLFSVATFPVALMAAYEVRQDAYTPDGPHTSGVLACVTLFAFVFGLVGAFAYLFMEDAYKYAAFGSSESLWWSYAQVKYRSRCFPVLSLALLLVQGGLVGGVASTYVVPVLLLLHLAYVGLTYWLQPFVHLVVYHVTMGLELIYVGCLGLLWVALAAGDGVGYGVVGIVLVVVLALALHQMLLVFSLLSKTCFAKPDSPAYTRSATTARARRHPTPATGNQSERLATAEATLRPKRSVKSNRHQLPAARPVE